MPRLITTITIISLPDDWKTNWIEDGDSGTAQSPTAGNIQVVTDATNGTTYALRFTNNGAAIARMAALPSNAGISLDFDYRRALNGSGQYVNVQAVRMQRMRPPSPARRAGSRSHRSREPRRILRISIIMPI